MGNFNRWGCEVDAVLEKYRMGDYIPTAEEFGGADEVGREMDSAAWLIEQALSAESFQALTSPELLKVVSRATAGQVAFTIPLVPLIADLLSVWTGQPSAFEQKPIRRTDPNPHGVATVELPGAAFSVNATTGVVTLAGGYALQADDVVFVSFDADTTAAAYSVPSLADLVAIGAAGAIGPKLYPRDSASWEHVTALRERFTAAIEALQKGELIPTEVRTWKWWKEIEKTQEQTMTSVRRYRS